jgi:hypothetical protein
MVIKTARELAKVKNHQEIVWKDTEGRIRIGTADVDDRGTVTAINQATITAAQNDPRSEALFLAAIVGAERIDIQETPFEEDEQESELTFVTCEKCDEEFAVRFSQCNKITVCPDCQKSAK